MNAPIEVSALTKTFGRNRGIEDVSFTVDRGQVFGFLGPNGAGKSTTIRLILGLYRPTAGQLRVLGKDPTAEPVAAHRDVGYLPGELALFPKMTGRQHLGWFARGRGITDMTMCDELAERFGAELDRPIHTLSKGNRQKIGIILAFFHRPHLLVLDEPTSGLDPLLQDEFAHLLRETVDDGRTVFLSSHELDEVQRTADRVAIIKDGRLVLVDTVEGLRSTAPRTVEFQFGTPVESSTFTGLPGVDVVSNRDGLARLTLTGPLAPVLAAAAALDPIDMTARPADLDELFLRYYRTDTAQARTGGPR